MTLIHLVEPSTSLRDSYLNALVEYRTAGHDAPEDLPEPDEGFDAFVKRLRQLKGSRQSAAADVYWLVDGETFIGRLTLHHRLDPERRPQGGHLSYVIRPSKRRRGYGRVILRQGLIKAKQQGLAKVLLTCEAGNLGARRVIEANGGIGEPVAGAILSYWVALDPTPTAF